MKKYILILLVILVSSNLFGQRTLSDTSFTANSQQYRFLTTFLEVDGRTVLTIFHGSEIIRLDTLDIDGLPHVSYPDFDSDGYTDIIIESFIPYQQYRLYLFDGLSSTYKFIDDDNDFPNSEPLQSNPKYYYSYKATGCTDLYWISKLFCIENFKFIELGYIFGDGCGPPPGSNSDEHPMQIKIYKVLDNGDKSTTVANLQEQLPYLENIPRFEDKWNFIKKYWNENYKKYAK